MGGAQGAALPETFELGLRTTLATGDVEAAFGIYAAGSGNCGFGEIRVLRRTWRRWNFHGSEGS